MKIEITKNHIPKGERRSGIVCEKTSITIHNTGNSKSSAKDERAWLTSLANKGLASYNYVIDDKDCIECIPPTEESYHCAREGNKSSIGVEICEKNFDAVYPRAVKFIAELLHARKWDITHIRTHASWGSNHSCPRLILPKYTDFLKEVARELKELEKEKPIADWKIKTLKTLHEKGIVSDYDKWIDKLDDKADIWYVNELVKNIFNLKR